MALQIMSVNRSKILNGVLRNFALSSRRTLIKKFDKDTMNPKPYESIPKVPTVPFIGSTWAYFPYIGKY